MEDTENTNNCNSTAVKQALASGKSLSGTTFVQTPGKSRPRTCDGSAKKPMTPMSPAPSLGSTSREAARVAKLQNTAERVRKVAELKEKWAKEKKRKTLFYQNQRARELQRIQEVSKVAAEARKRSIRMGKKLEEEQRRVLQEQLSASLQDRAQLARDVEHLVKERRRQSVLINSDILRKAKERQAAVDQERKAEEESLHETRRLDAFAAREAKIAEEINRRESMARRGEAHRKQREAEEEMARKLSEEEHQRIQFRHESWKDEIAAKQVESQRKRESVAGRLDSWRKEKTVSADNLASEMEARAIDADLRRQDWIDTQNYKQSLEKAARESLQGRLVAWRNEKAVEQTMLVEAEEAAQLEAEFQRQAAEDLRWYHEKQKRSKRESLAYRLDKAREDRNFEQGQRAIQQALEAEERRIAELDREDVANYHQKLRAAMRQSLEYRNQTEFQEKMRLQGESEIQRVQEAADKELRDEDWRAVQEYYQQEREKERRETAVRLVESRKQQEAELASHRAKLDAIHEDLELKYWGWKDVVAAKEAEKMRSRKSVAFRLESWRQQRIAEEMLAAKKAMEAEEDAMLREQDREALTQAKEAVRRSTLLEFTNTRMMA